MKNILTTTISSFLYFYVFSYVFKARVNESKILILEKQKTKLNFHLKNNISWRFRQSVNKRGWTGDSPRWPLTSTARSPPGLPPLKEWRPSPPPSTVAEKTGKQKTGESSAQGLPAARTGREVPGKCRACCSFWFWFIFFIFFSPSFLGIKTKSEWAAAAAGLDRHNREIKMSRRNDGRTNEWTSLSAERDVPSGNELEISSSSSHLSWELISSCH